MPLVLSAAFVSSAVDRPFLAELALHCAKLQNISAASLFARNSQHFKKKRENFVALILFTSIFTLRFLTKSDDLMHK